MIKNTDDKLSLLRRVVKTILRSHMVGGGGLVGAGNW